MGKITELASGQITATESIITIHSSATRTSKADISESNPLRRNLPRLEGKALAQRKVMHGARDEDASGVGSRAQPRGELHRGAEEVVTLGNRLTRGHPDADVNLHSAAALCVRNSPLDLHGACDGADNRGERGH